MPNVRQGALLAVAAVVGLERKTKTPNVSVSLCQSLGERPAADVADHAAGVQRQLAAQVVRDLESPRMEAAIDLRSGGRGSPLPLVVDQSLNSL
jgi:hypothetical protein